MRKDRCFNDLRLVEVHALVLMRTFLLHLSQNNIHTWPFSSPRWTPVQKWNRRTSSIGSTRLRKKIVHRLRWKGRSKERIPETRWENAGGICRGHKAVEERVLYPDDWKVQECRSQHRSVYEEVCWECGIERSTIVGRTKVKVDYLMGNSDDFRLLSDGLLLHRVRNKTGRAIITLRKYL